MTKKCKRCGLPQVDFPLFVDENNYPLEKEQIKEKLKNGDYKGFKWQNLFKMDLLTLSFILIVLILAFAYNLDTKKYQEYFSSPCNLTKKVAYSGLCELNLTKVINANALYQTTLNMGISTPFW